MWHYREAGKTITHILDGNRLVGSIVHQGNNWSVEILWHADDIKGSFTEYGEALAFCQGVETLANRLTDERPKAIS